MENFISPKWKTSYPLSGNLISPKWKTSYTVLSNGTLLKQDEVILPNSLHEKVIHLVHNGSQPEQNALKRHLRNHFYIKDLDIKIIKYIRDCSYCQMFIQKTLRHLTEPNSVPEKCREPSRHHVLVVQDLASRYPVAKIVKSTNAKSVIPVLRDAYDLFGNPLRQKSDNGPPFNCSEMAEFGKNRNIEQVKTPPGHPAANNVETVMKPLGKAMKIGNMQNLPEQETLSAFLRSYRDTLHVSTGVPSAHTLFRDGFETTCPATRHQTIKLEKLDKQIGT